MKKKIELLIKNRMKHKKNAIFQKLQKFWKQILHLPFGRRLSFFASISTLVFLFFPWFSDAHQSFSVFEKTFLFGGIIFLCITFSLLLILREIFSSVGVLGNFKHSDLLIGCFAQSLLVVILANASLSTLLLEKPEYSIGNIWIMMTFVSLGVGLAGVFFSRDFIPQNGEKKNVFVDENIDLSRSTLKAERKLNLGDYQE